eukprot:CAMPEP_0114291080 /NCGR_PEP_ID=MMETSP0059-20121206/8290_1 /TAXON_ID=36894 /ORGANISM="Pyramimonas parkeae, Strain CCMP726" /LENGTH=239 /DNA_ID=CAMNT_0001412543 /DNA_START=659 /DNA_END=1374 /DNA_ORIENTATION=-
MLMRWMLPLLLLAILRYWQASRVGLVINVQDHLEHNERFPDIVKKQIMFDREDTQLASIGNLRGHPNIQGIKDTTEDNSLVSEFMDEDEPEEPGLEAGGVPGAVSGGRLLDLEATTQSHRRVAQKSAAKNQKRGVGASKGGAGAAGGPPLPDHDVGVRGYLPRVNHTALVSRFNPALRPASRYMHMASIAKVGDRFVAAWQGSKIYEGYADQRIWHTFSKDSTGRTWGPQRTIPMMDVG